jgi:hypothetical protein
MDTLYAFKCKRFRKTPHRNIWSTTVKHSPYSNIWNTAVTLFLKHPVLLLPLTEHLRIALRFTLSCVETEECGHHSGIKQSCSQHAAVWLMRDRCSVLQNTSVEENNWISAQNMPHTQSHCHKYRNHTNREKTILVKQFGLCALGLFSEGRNVCCLIRNWCTDQKKERKEKRRVTPERVITPPEAETHHNTTKKHHIHTYRNENRSRRNTTNKKIANRQTTRS